VIINGVHVRILSGFAPVGDAGRGIKQRTHPMCGFKSFGSAERFCQVYDEVRIFFRARSLRNESVLSAW